MIDKVKFENNHKLKKLILIFSECLRTDLQGLTQLDSLTLVSNSNNFLKMKVFKTIPQNLKKLNLDLLIQTKKINHKLPVPENLYHFGCRAKALSHFNFNSCLQLRSMTLFHTNLVDESDPLWRLLPSTIHSLRLEYRASTKEKPGLKTDGCPEGKYFGINVPVKFQHLTLKLNFPFSDNYSKQCMKRIYINTHEPQWSNDLLHKTSWDKFVKVNIGKKTKLQIIVDFHSDVLIFVNDFVVDNVIAVGRRNNGGIRFMKKKGLNGVSFFTTDKVLTRVKL
ncbi:unnamed protein product [Ambrosiozyma monospora]|uniref:Unnamed protein product n=1 Tax=Ambrosiozyma monospora TaxID=43982 RepID=A0A9W6YWR3_AMBMO|nr:unnamed protein product [Ambrosiozyma monospora]